MFNNVDIDLDALVLPLIVIAIAGGLVATHYIDAMKEMQKSQLEMKKLEIQEQMYKLEIINSQKK